MLVIATEMGTNSYHKNINNNGTVELVIAADMEAPSMRHGIWSEDLLHGLITHVNPKV